jgi:hypothetical protein
VEFVVVKVVMGLVAYKKLGSAVNFHPTNSSIFVQHPTPYRLDTDSVVA